MFTVTETGKSFSGGRACRGGSGDRGGSGGRGGRCRLKSTPEVASMRAVPALQGMGMGTRTSLGNERKVRGIKLGQHQLVACLWLPLWAAEILTERPVDDGADDDVASMQVPAICTINDMALWALGIRLST